MSRDNLAGNVIELSTVREKKISERRKNTHRIVFQNVFMSYAILSDRLMVPTYILDMSVEGIAFYIRNKQHMRIEQEHLKIRIYLTKETFFEININIKNTRDMIIEGAQSIRYGCSVDTNQAHHQVYVLMVEFMTRYAHEAKIDKRY